MVGSNLSSVGGNESEGCLLGQQPRLHSTQLVYTQQLSECGGVSAAVQVVLATAPDELGQCFVHVSLWPPSHTLLPVALLLAAVDAPVTHPCGVSPLLHLKLLVLALCRVLMLSQLHQQLQMQLVRRWMPWSTTKFLFERTQDRIFD